MRQTRLRGGMAAPRKSVAKTTLMRSPGSLLQPAVALSRRGAAPGALRSRTCMTMSPRTPPMTEAGSSSLCVHRTRARTSCPMSRSRLRKQKERTTLSIRDLLSLLTDALR